MSTSKVQIRTFRKGVCLSVDDNHSLTPEEAVALAQELERFAGGCRDGLWYGARVLVDGKFVNECDGKTKPIVV